IVNPMPIATTRPSPKAAPIHTPRCSPQYKEILPYNEEGLGLSDRTEGVSDSERSVASGSSSFSTDSTSDRGGYA
ncbi:MAG: hypothetical protein LE168_05430, partial [Endomicrobium sp.]|nr:hypothetical protein [Endomicrobium sp.]